MLAKLALTPRESRDFSTLVPSIILKALLDLTENELYLLLNSFIEHDWIELMAICDQNTILSLESFYMATKKIAENHKVDESTRINTYIFLRSQNQHVSSPIAFLEFADIIYQSNNLEALAVLLLDSYFPGNGLATLEETKKQKLANHFSALIEWAQSNTDAVTTKKLMRHFALMESQLVLIQLIEYAQSGVCTWEELYDLFSPLTPIIADDLFSIFFLNQMLNELPASGEISIAEVLKYFDALPDFKNNETANKVFSVFIAPALKAHPEYLLSTGKSISKLYPRLLEAFAPLVADMTFDTETIHFLAETTLKLAHDWEPSIRSEDNLLASDLVRILENIELDFDDPHTQEQFENFIAETEEEYSDLMEAKDDFIGMILMPKKAGPVFDAMDKNLRLSAQRTLHRFLKAPGVFEKISENSAEQLAYDLQKIIPGVEKISPKLAIWILTQTDVSSAPSLFSALTTVDNYIGVEDDVTQLINHPDFHIENYYASASLAFKQLPNVTIAMQLYCFSNKNVDIAFVEESHQYTTTLHQALAPTAYEDSRLLGSLLAYRITEDERVNNSGDTIRAVRKSVTTFMKQHLVNGKDAKIPFLRYMLTHLMQHGEFSSNHTAYPDAPFIWSLYAEAYLPIKAEMKGEVLSEENKRYLPEKITKINVWLKEQILEAPNAPETKTLLRLSEALRHAIFSFEGSDIDAVTLLPKPAKRSSVILNAASLWTTQETTAKKNSNTPEHK